jgi:ribonucleoside-diphosphate reductase alpha chain
MSVAPTGTMSLTFGNNCSSGIEPIFSLSYDRKVKMGGQSDDNIEIVKMEDYAYKLWKETVENNIVSEDIFITAMDMSVQDHVNMLRNITWHVDMSVSKTINVPTDYSFDDTKKIYDECYKAGIKGCTIFRPNEIRQGILISETNKSEKINTYETVVLPRGYIEEVPDGLNYRKYKLKTGCGNLYLFLGVDEIEGKIYDCFTNTDGVGGCTINTQANSRLLSASLRGGVPAEYLVQQLEKAGTCPSFQYKKGKGEKLCKGKSCSSAIANVLKDVLKEFKEEELMDIKIKSNTPNETTNPSQKCPECGEPIRFEGGCNICPSCGWSKCS